MGILARLASIPGVVGGIRERDLPASPWPLFDQWYRMARRCRVYWPNSMALATANRDGNPSVRMVLMKGYDDQGIVFYTNYDSRKGIELEENPRAEVVLYWNDLIRQVRASGRVARVSREESEAYFHSRPRGSQIGAWASHQDQPVESRPALMARVKEYQRKFHGGPVPLPEYWGGYRLMPDAFEFWQGRTYRLHDRFVYTRTQDGAWSIQRLSP
ncbi:MAG: pyridoxamine 5'-phosphate oxidase [Kiritimatiellae bacterium]|nr:pyridoxamine 5'-phosphate oxidase [Kiritimatiellia bacterium]